MKVPADINQAALFLFVYYQDQKSPTIEPQLCMAIRDTLAAAYLSGDRIDPSRTRTEPIEFLGREAIEIYGLYQNYDPPMGGPFKMYCFHAYGRLYVVDLAVFNPPESKTPDLRVLEAIARTFEVTAEGGIHAEHVFRIVIRYLQQHVEFPLHSSHALQ